jgi:hypothetical protein
MAKYRFKCEKCSQEVEKYVPPLVEEVSCSCGDTMHRQMPTLNGPATVRETVDKYTGNTWIADQSEIIADRKAKYYWSVEVPRLVNSGTYSLQTMLEQGWVSVDDAGKIHINDKPPEKR